MLVFRRVPFLVICMTTGFSSERCGEGCGVRAVGCLFMFALVWGEPESKSVYCLLESIPYSRSQAQISAMSGEPGCILHTVEHNKFVPVSALCRPSL